jgi:putative transposase
MTHAFEDCVFAMPVSQPRNALYARLPQRISKQNLSRLEAMQGSQWGKIPLPEEMLASDSDASTTRALLELIEPLIQACKSEKNLQRTDFRLLLRSRCEITGIDEQRLFRMLMRYWYFGGTGLGLSPLQRGPPPRTAEERKAAPSSYTTGARRRGRQAIETSKLGPNRFIVRDEDIADMMTALRRKLFEGRTFLTDAHESYLKTEFRARHPKFHSDFVTEKIPEPVTYRQFCSYLRDLNQLEDSLRHNLRTRQRGARANDSIRAHGPGEIYEVDATGGRLHVVSTQDPPVHLGKPLIYLLIDRFSRYVVSVYISLKPASWEELRHALLVAFTSRAARFDWMGVDVNDTRWPPGVPPMLLCCDRGPEFLGDAMRQTLVNAAHLEVTLLPPQCPDGKAIIERFIRELKHRMKEEMAGTYADRPLTPQARAAERKGQKAAVHTLAQAYRVLIEIVIEHNNKPHKKLRANNAIKRAGISPTPQAVYGWGLANITGLQRTPLSDQNWQRLLMTDAKGSLKKGLLTYRKRPYAPADALACDIAAKAAHSAQSIDLKADSGIPYEVWHVTKNRRWACFRMTEGARNALSMMTQQEEDALKERTDLAWALARNKTTVSRVARGTFGDSALTSPALASVDRETQRTLRDHETRQMQGRMKGAGRSPQPTRAPPKSPDSGHSTWEEIEGKERAIMIDRIHSHRSSNRKGAP